MESKEEPQQMSARRESQTQLDEEEETKKVNKLSFSLNAPVRAKLADHIKKPLEAGGGVQKQRTVVRGRQVVTKVAGSENQ